MSCLHVEHLTVRFDTPAGTVTAVEDLSLTHRSGECLGLVGETGCGKSVLALALPRLLPDTSKVTGDIRFEGRDMMRIPEEELNDLRGRRLALIPQNPTLALNPIYRIGHQLGEIFRRHDAGLPRGAALDRVRGLLERVGIREAAAGIEMYPFQFSEGMNQRVLIAAALALGPGLIVADEPTRGLDEKLRDEVMGELELVRDTHGTGLFLITHDLTVARSLCDRIAVMYAGRLLETAPAEAFFREPLHPYSRGLIDSLPENGFTPIPGPSPSLITPPGGCRFHPRCPRRVEVCSEEEPELRPHGPREIRCHLYR